MTHQSERRSRDYYERRARWYDWANRAAALLRRESATSERRKAVERLGLRPGDRVLEVSVGTGTNLPFIGEAVGVGGQIVGLDISPAMLAECRRKMHRAAIRADLVEGEASRLPFDGDTFDAVFHHGGIAEFGDPKGAIEEMMRVARPGAKLVICDVGRPAGRRLSLVNRLLLRFQPEYDKPPPLDLVPGEALDTRLSWFHGGAWYMIVFVKP